MSNKDFLNFVTIDETPELVREVVGTVTRAVTATMGPNGKLSVITIGNNPKVTKDGVSVARAIQFNDARKELINRVITEPAIKTDEECGDGTTTTIMLMNQFFKVYSDYNSFQKHAFIDMVARMWIDQLQQLTVHIHADDPRLYELARTSSNNDEVMSRLVVDLYRDCKDAFPYIDLIQGVESDDKVIRTDGLRINMELSNPAYAANSISTVSFDNYVPVVVEDFIKPDQADNLEKFVKAMLETYKGQNVQILLIARSIETQIDNLLLGVNKQMNASNAVGPRFTGVRTNLGGSLGTKIMQDLSIMLGATMMGNLDQIDLVPTNVRTDKLTITGNKSIFHPSDEARERIAERVKEVEELLGSYDARTRFSRKARFDEDRVRGMTGAVVTLWVGGETVSEVKERKDRFEDVIKAVKSALVNGILPGVGTSLIYAMEAVAEKLMPDLGNNAPSFKMEIIGALVEASRRQYEYLMKGTSEVELFAKNDEGRYLVTNLATGEVGVPEDLGIFDTAYAAITALRGGAQTAKILATMDSVLISSKLNSVTVTG